MSSVVQPGLAHYHPQLLYTSLGAAVQEVNPQVPYRIYPQIKFSHVLVGSVDKSDVAHLLLTLVGGCSGLA